MCSWQRSRCWLMALVLSVCCSCGDDGILNGTFKYSDYHCNMTINNSHHLDATLASSQNALSPGVFCKISFKIEKGARYFVFENNQNQQSQSIFNAEDERLQTHLHIGQNNGVIVGYGNQDNPAVFYAYDAQCPNCFSLNALPLVDSPLTFTGVGMVVCNRCKRQYKLNSDGISTTDGKPLELYRATSSGPNGVLHIY